MRGHGGGMLMWLPVATFLDQARSGKQFSDCAGGPSGLFGDLGMARRQAGKQLACAPIRMLTPGAAEQLGHRARDSVGTVTRSLAPVPQVAASAW
jgi:hypothetical protein